jgi:hypothetical protein
MDIYWLNEWQEGSTEVKIESKVTSGVPYKYRYGYSYEMESPEGDFDFGDEEENKAYLKKFETGELLNMFLYVEVWLDGFKGTNSLGHVHINSSKENEEMLEIIQGECMLNEAIEDAKDNLIKTAKNLQKYL